MTKYWGLAGLRLGLRGGRARGGRGAARRGPSLERQRLRPGGRRRRARRPRAPRRRRSSCSRRERDRLAAGLARARLDHRADHRRLLPHPRGRRARPAPRLLARGCLVRDCTSFGLPAHVRVSPRHPVQNDRLLEAFSALAPPEARRRGCGRRRDDTSAARVVMLQGTASHAGKTVLAAALCRIYARRGYRVAPFKAQNMALNSFVTADGGEMGRAQVYQARAAGLEPHVDMNPVLLKPSSDATSQVVVMGRPVGHMTVREYHGYQAEVWPVGHLRLRAPAGVSRRRRHRGRRQFGRGQPPRPGHRQHAHGAARPLTRPARRRHRPRWRVRQPARTRGAVHARRARARGRVRDQQVPRRREPARLGHRDPDGAHGRPYARRGAHARGVERR